MPGMVPGAPVEQMSHSLLASIMTGPEMKDRYSKEMPSSSAQPFSSMTYQGRACIAPEK